MATFNKLGKSNVLASIFMFVFLLHVSFIYINDKKINKDLIYKLLVVIFFWGGGLFKVSEAHFCHPVLKLVCCKYYIIPKYFILYLEK